MTSLSYSCITTLAGRHLQPHLCGNDSLATSARRSLLSTIYKPISSLRLPRELRPMPVNCRSIIPSLIHQVLPPTLCSRFANSIFPRGMILPLPANAAESSKGSSTGMARNNRRAQIVLGEEDRRRLERIRTSPQSLARYARRADIVLHPGDGCGLARTMRATGMSKPTVWRWRGRFLDQGVANLLRDIPRRPFKETYLYGRSGS